MSLLRGRSVVVLTYSTLAGYGLLAQASGFLFLFTLQLDLLGLILLYALRPQRVRNSKQPDETMLFMGSMPLLLLNWVLAAALGAAVGDYPTTGPGSFAEKPVLVWKTAMITLSVASVLVVVLDRVYYNKRDELWLELPSQMAIKGALLACLGYVGFGLLLWFGEENKNWVIPALLLVRIALEYVLQPLPSAPAASKGR